jgi:hypothetical protein
VDRSDLHQIIRAAGCTVTRHAADGFPAEFDCPDPWQKVRMLDALALRDARYDPRVRKIATAIAAIQPDTRPRTLARALHKNVARRVRYLGEGIETFQNAAETWRIRLGDCDDMARLLVALARSIGLDAQIVALPGRGGQPVHASCTVLGQWADPSMPGARFGEHPIAAYRRLRAAGAPTRYHGDMGDLGQADGGGGAAETRAILTAAWDQVPGLPGKTPAALQAVQAISSFEGGAGVGCWTSRGGATPCPGVCHNWGAEQLPGSPVTHDGSTPNCPAGSAPCVDSHPNADGSNTYFGVCFKTFDTREAGAVSYLRTLLVQFGTAGAIGSGDADAIASSMYRNHYFGGYGATAEERIAGYASAIERSAASVASSLGEPVYVTRKGGAGASDGDGGPLDALGPLLGSTAGLAALGVAGWIAYRRGWHRKLLTAIRF